MDVRPETIEGDWDRFYLEFPDVYDRFALTSLAVMPALRARYGIEGAAVLDAGSGTGRSTFALAESARSVVGLEPWDPMRAYAARRRDALGLGNVGFVTGAVEAMPFGPRSFDHVVSVYGFPFWFPDDAEHGLGLGRGFVADCRSIVRPGGWVVAVIGVPGQYAGEFTPVVAPALAAVEPNGMLETYMEGLGFAWWDVDVDADYGTVEEAVATYGFIYGRRAIDHLRASQISRIRWRLRVYELRIDG